MILFQQEAESWWQFRQEAVLFGQMVVLAGSKRSQIVSAEAKYDWQQEEKLAVWVKPQSHIYGSGHM